MSAKAPITCHVLDTSIGRPARGVRVLLQGPSRTNSFPFAPGPIGVGTWDTKIFEAETDDDGRINNWQPLYQPAPQGPPNFEPDNKKAYSVADAIDDTDGPSHWALRFATADYFGRGERTFFAEATVVFRVEKGERYHVPLLLSPYGYTTYRGS